MKVLLIGGSHDGVEIEVADGSHRITLPVRELDKSAYGLNALSYRTEIYESMRFSANDFERENVVFDLFVVAGMPSSEVMQRLLHRYAKIGNVDWDSSLVAADFLEEHGMDNAAAVLRKLERLSQAKKTTLQILKRHDSGYIGGFTFGRGR